MPYSLPSHGEPIPSPPAAELPLSWSAGPGNLESIASMLYRIATMLVGVGDRSVELVEKVVAQLDLSQARTHDEAVHIALLTLGGAAVSTLTFADSSALAAPEGEPGAVTCIEDDDLDSVGVSRQSFEHFLHGADDAQLRFWLESLSTPLRVTFVLHAVAGLNFGEVAQLLVGHAGTDAATWTSSSVRAIFRQGLCSLASQLIQAAVSTESPFDPAIKVHV